jgi:hypothetical protein
MGIVLGPNQYGKAEVRVVVVDRGGPRHRIKDLTVSSALRGDFAAAHLAGDNAHVLATDTQKNTVFAFARDGVGGDRGLRAAAGPALRRRVSVDHRRPGGGRRARRRRPAVRAEEGSVLRDDAPDAGPAWIATPGFG